MKTLHAVPCSLCHRRGVVYNGWCPQCLVRGVKSMQAMAAPVMTFLMENHAVVPGDKMPYGEDLLAKLRGICNAPAKDPLREGDDVDHPQGTPEAVTGPGPAGDHPDSPCGTPAQ